MLKFIRRYARWLAVTAVAAATVGGFLAWGPVGLGNGPLRLTVSGDEWAWTDDQIEPVGYVLPLGDDGPGVAIVDAVSVTSSPRFAPSTLRQALIGHLDGAGCIALGPFTGRGSVLPGCAPPVLKSAAGAAVEVTQFSSVERVQAALVLELSAPRPGRCWDITAVVVRYHVGIRHYAATFPEGNVIACGPGGKVPDSLDL